MTTERAIEKPKVDHYFGVEVKPVEFESLTPLQRIIIDRVTNGSDYTDSSFSSSLPSHGLVPNEDQVDLEIGFTDMFLRQARLAGDCLAVESILYHYRSLLHLRLYTGSMHRRDLWFETHDQVARARIAAKALPENPQRVPDYQVDSILLPALYPPLPKLKTPVFNPNHDEFVKALSSQPTSDEMIVKYRNAMARDFREAESHQN